VTCSCSSGSPTVVNSHHCWSYVESNYYQAPNVFHWLCSSPTCIRKSKFSFGPLTRVTRALGTHSCLDSLFFSSFVSLLMNFAFTLSLTLLKRKWLFSNIDEFLGKVGKGRIGKRHSLVWCPVTRQCWQYEPTSLMKLGLISSVGMVPLRLWK
jgi:hypothetical protein